MSLFIILFKTKKLMKENSIQAQWDEIFTTGVVKLQSKRELCAAAFSALALLYSGNEPPKKFGEGMAAIGEKLGFSAMNEPKLTEYAKQNGWLN